MTWVLVFEHRRNMHPQEKGNYMSSEAEKIGAITQAMHDALCKNRELHRKIESMQSEIDSLKEYRDKIYDYVQCTGNTGAEFLGYHVADALVMDHKKLRILLREAVEYLEPRLAGKYGSHGLTVLIPKLRAAIRDREG